MTMASEKVVTWFVVVCLIGQCTSSPAKGSFWKGTPLEHTVEEMRSNCADGSDSLACMKFKVINFLDTIFRKDNYQLGDMEIRQNGFTGNQNSARSDPGLLEKVEEYIESHDVTVDVPMSGAKVTISPKNINENELNVKVKFAEEGRGVGDARKSKLKKIIIPIMVLVLLKALTLIPFALGILGLKAWNALQLSFFSFITSLALAVFQLCKKIALDNHHPQIAAHAPWDTRSFESYVPILQTDGQDLAYKGQK